MQVALEVSALTNIKKHAHAKYTMYVDDRNT